MAETNQIKPAEQKTDENAVTYFAKTNFRNKEVIFGVKSLDRRQHMYVIGKTGTGKTTLLNNLAIQDIKAGRGVCIVDPHGEFVENILQKIPNERMNDVIYFNPVDVDYPIGFNVLEVADEKYKHLVASDLMGIFTKIWANVWSARMEYILNNCVLALLDTPGTTLLGIPRILVDKDYRQKILANVKDPVVKAFWVHEYEDYNERFRGEAIAPIQNKVGQFLSTPLIRNIVGQAKSTINIQEIMNTGKILLVNVSKGRVGEDNSALLGAMLITKIQLAAMERIRVREEERRDFYLYVDEFQNFATDSFAGILSEARKYALNLVVAHQYIGQLVTDVSTRVRDAIFGNVGTMIIFRVGAGDAEYLEPEFEPEFVIQDLVNLPNREIYVKLMVNGVTSRPFSAATLPPMALAGDEENREEIIRISRERYANPIKEVTDQINHWSGIMGTGEGNSREGSAGGGDAATQYEISCSNCGKRSRVSFEPDPGRPVYCQDCLKKIKSGELSPLRVRRMQSGGGAREGGHESHLGELGIEFATQGESRSPRFAGEAGSGRFAQTGAAHGSEPSFRRESRSPGGGQESQSRVIRNERPQFDRRSAPPAATSRNFTPSVSRGRLNLPQGPAREGGRGDFREIRREDRARPAPFGGRPFRGEPVVRIPERAPTASLNILQKKEPERRAVKEDNVPREDRHKKELDVAGLRAMLEESLKETEIKDTKVANDANVTKAANAVRVSNAGEKKSGTLRPGESVKL